MAPDAQPVRLNTEWLSACGGCHVALVDLHEKVLDVLEAVRIQRCPVLMDTKDYPPADVGIVTGAIRSEHDRQAAEAMRQACRTIIAFGTCAVFGGIPGAALAHSREEILDCVYRRSRTTRSDTVPDEEVTGLEQTVTPVDQVIPVDLYLPGCPPHPAFVFDALLSVVEGRPPKARDESVCGHCRRRMRKSEVSALRPAQDGPLDPAVCFLSQGAICLGSVTLDRCLSPCPNQGIACSGCAGPTQRVLAEPNVDIRTEVADRMARLTKIEPAQVVSAVEAAAKTHYAYAMASPMVNAKPTFLIRRWIAATEGTS